MSSNGKEEAPAGDTVPATDSSSSSAAATAAKNALEMAGFAPEMATEAVLVKSEKMPPGSVEIRGYDFNNGVNFDAMMKCFATTGFQASNIARAVHEINRMRAWRLSDEKVRKDEDEEYRDPEVRAKTKCKIFFSFTSNMASCGQREVVRYLCEHKMVDVIVTTCGGIEEDLMKCLRPHYMGDFKLDGATLRKKGINRIGNLLVPNENYVKFEDFLMPILEAMSEEQRPENGGVTWSPSTMIDRLGKEIDDESSFCYWAHKNKIPIFCPAITDGSIGDMLYFWSYKAPADLPFVVDIVQDIKRYVLS